MVKSNSQRQKLFHEKMTDSGFRRVVVYAPRERAIELRNMAATMRSQSDDPSLLGTLKIALNTAKGALSASVDQNTKNDALKTVKKALAELKENEEPI